MIKIFIKIRLKFIILKNRKEYIYNINQTYFNVIKRVCKQNVYLLIKIIT